MKQRSTSLFQLAVLVSAMGFFVDVFDLLLFGIIRKPSLAALGLPPKQVLTTGELIISVQMVGLVVGGVVWGILGDKKGRLRVLFGSILIYSLATMLNGLVASIPPYLLLRFIAGVGLAGELGAGITLVSEILPKQKRGMASALIASFGILGAITAVGLSRIFGWRELFYMGGFLGLILLVLRLSVQESSLYTDMKGAEVESGNFLMFFTNRRRFMRYLKCILIGLPTWYIIGVIITFSDQFGAAFGIPDIDPGVSIMFFYLALAFGDLSVGLVSQALRSRKKALFIFYGLTMVFGLLFFLQHNGTKLGFYLLCSGLGFGAGFNVVYITMSAEQFGTNLRASSAISVPNMVRGMLPLIILLFKFMRQILGNYVRGGWVTGVILMIVAIVAAWKTQETFGKDLDFMEN
jgi:MFS transporter, putative metabolite:H+ symporter